MQETWVQFLVRKIPWRRKWQPTPVLSLENSVDRGAWPTTVHGITRSWTQLSDWFSFSLSKHWWVISLCLRKINYGVLIFGEWVKLRKSLLFIWNCHGGRTDIVRYLKGGIHKSIESIKWLNMFSSLKTDENPKYKNTGKTKMLRLWDLKSSWYSGTVIDDRLSSPPGTLTKEMKLL